MLAKKNIANDCLDSKNLRSRIYDRVNLDVIGYFGGRLGLYAIKIW